MLTISGKINGRLEDNVSMTSCIHIDASLCSMGMITTKGNPPMLCLGDLIYEQTCMKNYKIVDHKKVVLQRADDFEGYRLVFRRSNFLNKLEAYKMCVELLVKELDIDRDVVLDCMSFEKCIAHGVSFSHDLGKELKCSVFMPDDMRFSEFRFSAETNVDEKIKNRIRNVTEMKFI